MKINNNKYFFNKFKIVLAIAMFLLLSGSSFAQTFNIDGVNSSDPADVYVVSETTINAKIENVAGFNSGDKFYYYYTIVR
ncbi:MAG: hypothetical protein JEZ09_21145 [Salinivirgaceae bacterium]|nr:hypothetical protein [Salinivirgaceae bacterium]